VNEELLILLVHLGEVGHVIEEDLFVKRRVLAHTANRILEQGGVNKGGGYTLTRMILLTDEPAASRIALMLSQQAWVLVLISPSTRLPFLSAGIWPERKIWPLALTAWDYDFMLALGCQ
jgi:hypothetical protein